MRSRVGRGRTSERVHPHTPLRSEVIARGASRILFASVSRRKRLLIILIFFVAIAGPVFFVVLRTRAAAPSPPPAAGSPSVDADATAARKASARDAFERGLALQRDGDATGAAAAYREAVELDPELAGAWTNLGLALLKIGQTEPAMAAAQRAVDLPSLTDAKRRAHALFVVGHIADQTGAADRAIQAYADALAADPSSAAAALALANLQAERSRTADAIATLLAARDAGASTLEVNTNLAFLFIDAREPSKAVDAARLALRGKPDNPGAKLALGYAQLALKRWADAAQSLDEAGRSDLSNADVQTALGYAYEKLGRRDDALAAFDRALALRKDHPQAMQNRAITLDRMGEAAEAQKAYERIMAARAARTDGPGTDAGGAGADAAGAGADAGTGAGAGGAGAGAGGAASPPAAQLQLAVIAARKKDWAEARKFAEPVVAAEPKNALARYVLGLACFHLNDRKCAAEQEYELTLLDPERATALRKLISQH